jgi:hypothetical protein
MQTYNYTLLNGTDVVFRTNKLWTWPLLTGVALYRHEIILVMILALILIGFLNYQFESGFRMAFFGGLQAKNDTECMQVGRYKDK